MGMYDSVFISCKTPGCKQILELQSKGGACILDSFAPDEVPVEVAEDLEPTVKCTSCKKVWNVTTSSPAIVTVYLE